MPNRNKPMGLVPLSVSVVGGPIQTVSRLKAAGYGTKIRSFDVVNRVADGSIERSITPGTTLISGVSLNPGAASTETEHFIIEDPFQKYRAQAGGSTGLAAADAGFNANIALGSTELYFSDDIVDDGTEATGATLDLKIHDKLSQPDNAWGQYVKVIVSINKHRMDLAVAGV